MCNIHDSPLQLRVYNLRSKPTATAPTRRVETAALPAAAALGADALPEQLNPALAPALMAVELRPGAQQDVCFFPLPPPAAPPQVPPAGRAVTVADSAALAPPPPLDLALSMAFSFPTRYRDLGWSRLSASASGAAVYGAAARGSTSGVLLLGEDLRATASPLQVNLERSFAGRAATTFSLGADGSLGKDVASDAMRLNVLSAVHPRFWGPALSAAKVSSRVHSDHCCLTVEGLCLALFFRSLSVRPRSSCPRCTCGCPCRTGSSTAAAYSSSAS